MLGSIHSFNTSSPATAASPISLQDPTIEVMVYGAIQAYEYDMTAGMTQEADDAKKFLLYLQGKYIFSDGYTKKTLNDFCSLIQSGGDIKTWWEGLKTAGLISSDSSQPKMPLITWIDNNNPYFNPDSLPHDDAYVNNANFGLYSDMFFFQVMKENSDFPEISRDMNSYFLDPEVASANAGELSLQIYKACNQPEPPNYGEHASDDWNRFVAEIKTLLKNLPSNGEGGTYLNLEALSDGIIPYPYSNFRDYFADIENGTITPTKSPWSILSAYEHDLPEKVGLQWVSDQIAAFKAAGTAGNDLLMHQIHDSILNYISTNPNGAPLSKDKAFMTNLKAAIDLTKYSTNWSVNTPNGVKNLDPGNASGPPLATGIAISYQMTFSNPNDFKNAMENDSGSYPGSIPSPGQQTQYYDGQSTRDGSWNDCIESVYLQFILGVDTFSYGQLLSPGSGSGAQYSFNYNPNGSITVPVTIQGTLPDSILKGFTAKVDMNSNPALNQLIANFLPPPS